MHGNTLLASAATIAVAAALPQIVTTVTEPTTTTYNSGYNFGFPGFGGYTGYRSSGYRGYGYNPYSSFGGYNPYDQTVGSASLGFLPGALGSSTSINGYTGYNGYSGYGGYGGYNGNYQAPYVWAFPGDTKRTEAGAATDASLNVADSKTTLTKRQYGYGPIGGAIAAGWSSFLDSLGLDSDNVQYVAPVGSATLGGIVPSFTIDNGYPAPAYPVPAYPGASYSGPAVPQVYPNVPSSGSSTFDLSKKQ